MMIAPIIGIDAEELEGALAQGTMVVAQGLPIDEAQQLVGVFQGLGAEAEVCDPPRGLSPVAGDQPRPPGVSGTQPFNMAGLRKVLEAARSDAPPAVPPTGEIGLPPADAFAPPLDAAGFTPPTATRPFAPGLIRSALDRVGDDAPDLLPPLLGGDDEDGVPTAVAGPDGRRRAPGVPGGFGSGLMGVVNDDPAGAIPGETQSFGVGLYEPPPPAPPGGAPGPGEPDTPNWGALAGFAPRERFDPDAVSRLRGEGGPPPGLAAGRGGRPAGAYGHDLGRPARGASIADKPTDRLMPTYPPDMGLGAPPVDPLMGPPPVDDGLMPPPALPSLSAPTGMSLNDRPTTDIVPDQGMVAGHPMVVQLQAPAVDPSETGTFTREASLDPLEEEEAATRQLERPRHAPIKPGPPKRGVRPGVYRLPDRNAGTASSAGRSGAGPAAILSTGQMVARPTASPDEEVTDSGSFRIVSKPSEGAAQSAGHSPGTAALLSLVLPGMGQVYNGQRDRGMIFAVAAVLVVPWLFAIFDAFRTAQAIAAGSHPPPDRVAFKRNRWGQLVLNLAVLFSMLVVFTIWQGRQGTAPTPATPPPAPASTTP